MLIQQGDVLIETAKIPEGSISCEAGERGFVLAEGEVTGHAHRITKTKDVEYLQFEGKTYLRVKSPVPLEHEEHHIIIIEPGEYEVRKVVERDHFSRITREVLD